MKIILTRFVLIVGSLMSVLTGSLRDSIVGVTGKFMAATG
jgi:hypothetical protein